MLSNPPSTGRVCRPGGDEHGSCPRWGRRRRGYSGDCRPRTGPGDGWSGSQVWSAGAGRHDLVSGRRMPPMTAGRAATVCERLPHPSCRITMAPGVGPRAPDRVAGDAAPCVSPCSRATGPPTSGRPRPPARSCPSRQIGESCRRTGAQNVHSGAPLGPRQPTRTSAH